ncbi:MAG: PfkB family carbohydrate kinase [Limnobaculum xujianqingii]
MNAAELKNQLPSLTNQRPICVIGAAVIDVIADAYSLPHRGSDIELHQQGVNVGGCALNIAITLHRLGLSSLNALPMGQGIWADIIRKTLNEKGIVSALETDKGDNGWCLALVEPDGERTFLSVSGVENQWDKETLSSLKLQPDTLIYLSGYQLASATGGVLIDWLESLESNIELFIDFGPRIEDISEQQLARLMALKPMVSLNRQEAELMDARISGHTSVLSAETLADDWYNRYGCPLIIRVDKEGACYHDGKQKGWVKPFPAQVVDTIGAGDSHAGGVLAALSSGWSLADAVTLGNAVASYVVSHRGGDCAPSVTELSEYLKQYI